VKTWHAAIASLGTAAFLVAAYVAVLSVSGALFAFTDLSTVGSPKEAPTIEPVVATKPIKIKSVVAKAPKPEPAPEPEPAVAPAPPPAAVADAAPSGEGGGGSPSSSEAPAGPTVVDEPNFHNGGGNSREPADRDDAALVSDEGVNLSGTAKKLTDKVNGGLHEGTGIDLHKVTDPVVKVVDGLERGLGLDHQGR